jgi:hypothetical protein
MVKSNSKKSMKVLTKVLSESLLRKDEPKGSSGSPTFSSPKSPTYSSPSSSGKQKRREAYALTDVNLVIPKGSRIYVSKER